MVKLLENTFRAVNIGLVNEIALMSHRMNIDVWEVIDAAEHEAVRVHAVLSGSWPRRPLHSDRSVLPLVEGAPERVRVPVHRARRSRQRIDAVLRRRARGRGAQYREEGDQRLEGAPASASLTRKTSATCGSRRRSTCSSCCIGEVPSLSYTDPYVPVLKHGDIDLCSTCRKRRPLMASIAPSSAPITRCSTTAHGRSLSAHRRHAQCAEGLRRAAHLPALTATERDPLDGSDHQRDRTTRLPGPERNILGPPLIHTKIDAPKWRGSRPAARNVIADPLIRR